MVFEVGKYYEHTTGQKIHILTEVDTSDLYLQPCLIAECDDYSIIAVGKTEDFAMNFHEISREEWLNTFES